MAYWANSIFFGKSNPQYGISYFLGIPVLVIFLYIGNILFSIPLVTLSRIIFAVALLGILFHLRKNGPNRNLLQHPVFYLLPVAWLYFYFTPEVIYRPTSWDEYVRYLWRPKEMVWDNAILNPIRHGYGRGFDYTPGANLLLSYTSFLFKTEFSVGSVLAIPLISALALLGLAYDAVKSSIPKSFYIQGLLILVGIFSLFRYYLFPNHVLIEPFSIQANIALGLVFYFYIKEEFKTRKGLFVIGVFCAYAYLIKSPNIVLIPGLFLSFYLFQFSKWRLTSSTFTQFSKKNFIDSFYLVFPFVLVVGLWIWEMRAYSPTIQLYNGSSIGLWNSREFLMPKIWDEIINHFFNYSHSTIYFVIALLGYIWGVARYRHQRYFSIFMIGFFVVHIFLTVWVYRTMLGAYEAVRLVSFSRYMSVVYEPIMFFGLLFFVLNMFLFITQRKDKLISYKITPIRLKVFISILGSILLVLVLGFIHTTYTKVNMRPYLDFKDKTEVLLNEIKARDLYNTKVFVVAQGSDTREIIRIKFHVFQSEFIKRSVTLAGGRNLGVNKVNHWSVVESTSETRDRLLNSDVLWIEKTDSYIDKILESLIDMSTCKYNYKKYFLFKNSSGRFECGGLQNPTQLYCEDYMKKGKGTGIYTIDTDGFGPYPPLKVQCKMENGKAWTLVAKISSKNTEHVKVTSVNSEDFYLNDKFGKFSDDTINELAKNNEFRFKCGKGKFNEIFIKDHPWRSNVNSTHYGGTYSIDQKLWYAFKERGVTSWHGFDNYNAAIKNNHYDWFFAYHSNEVLGCLSSSNGIKSANGSLWAR